MIKMDNAWGIPLLLVVCVARIPNPTDTSESLGYVLLEVGRAN